MAATVKSIEEQLQELVRERLGATGGTASKKVTTEILQAEAERLKSILAKHIRAYYNSREPVRYVRKIPYNLAEALRVQVHDDNTIGIYFDEDGENCVWGESLVGHKGPHDYLWGFQPILIDAGWQVNKSVSFSNVHYFGYYEGYHFIEKAIKEFKQNNPYGIAISIEINAKSHMDYSTHFKVKRAVRDMYDAMSDL